jgi:NADH:ubiquinone oxidoreductase subunit H
MVLSLYLKKFVQVIGTNHSIFYIGTTRCTVFLQTQSGLLLHSVFNYTFIQYLFFLNFNFHNSFSKCNTIYPGGWASHSRYALLGSLRTACANDFICRLF